MRRGGYTVDKPKATTERLETVEAEIEEGLIRLGHVAQSASESLEHDLEAASQSASRKAEKAQARIEEVVAEELRGFFEEVER